MLVATAIVMSDGKGKEWTRCSKTNAGKRCLLEKKKKKGFARQVREVKRQRW